MSFTKHGIANLQHKGHQMVAPPGQNLRSLPTKRPNKGSCTKPPYRSKEGTAYSKCLRKREKRLFARQKDHMATCNKNANLEQAYRKPGSMR